MLFYDILLPVHTHIHMLVYIYLLYLFMNYVYMYYMYIYIPKYNNLSAYNVTCVYVFNTVYIYIIYKFMQYMYVYIPKYHLLGAYNITCMFMLSADYSALDNQILCFSMQRTSSLIPSFLKLFIVLCVRLSKALLSFLMMFGMLTCHSCLAHIWVVMFMRLCGGRLRCYQKA